MFNRGKVWIIPNEEEIVQPVYFREIEEGISHLSALQEFSDKFKLDLKFSGDDYQEAPIEIAKRGHLVIKSEDDSKILIFYIPKRVTDRQLEFFLNNEISLNNTYSTVGFFSLEEDDIETKYGILEVKKDLIRKNRNKHI